MTIEPIGKIRTCFGTKFAVPRQSGLSPSAWGIIELEKNFASQEIVRGLEGFSHLWLTFGFHHSVDKGWRPTVRPPRLGGEQRVGVFASRSPFRPNGLGLSAVEFTRVSFEKDGEVHIHVAGVDLVDATPIYDIRPYLPYADSISDAVGGFADLAPKMLSVSVSRNAQSKFENLEAREQAIIREVLALDPRPATNASDPERIYGAELCGFEVKFQIQGGVCEVVSITK